MRRRSGSIFISDLILSVMIVILLLPATVISVAVIHDAMRFNEEVQDEIALIQLRHILLISYELETDGSCLYYEYQGKEYRLHQVNDNLIIQPGTQIILAGIDDCGFVTENRCIILNYERKGKAYRAAVAAL